MHQGTLGVRRITLAMAPSSCLCSLLFSFYFSYCGFFFSTSLYFALFFFLSLSLSFFLSFFLSFVLNVFSASIYYYINHFFTCSLYALI
ncbi:hypothetical protein BDF14DRAFT_685297 [Spinellus fusiger]|nr:hypothetical protein BDF14DRAFT_685297 [Spinellus fusiger]